MRASGLTSFTSGSEEQCGSGHSDGECARRTGAQQGSGAGTALNRFMLAYEAQWKKEGEAWDAQLRRKSQMHETQLEAIKSATRARDAKTELAETTTAQMRARSVATEAVREVVESQSLKVFY